MIVPYVDPEEQGKQVKLTNVPEEYTHEILEDLHQAVRLDVETLVEAKFLAPQNGSCTVLLRYTDRDSARKAVSVLSGKPAMMSTGELKKLSAQLDQGYQDPILPSVLVSEVPLAYDETVLRGIHLQFDLDAKHVISFKFLPSKDGQTTSCIIRYCDTEAASIAIKSLTGRPVLTRAGVKKTLTAEFAKFADTKVESTSRSKVECVASSSSDSSKNRKAKRIRVKRSRSRRSKKRSPSRRRSKSRRRSRRRSKSRKRSRSRKKSRSRRRSKSRKRSRSKNKRRSQSRSKRKKSASSSAARKKKSRSPPRKQKIASFAIKKPGGKPVAANATPQSFDAASETSLSAFIKLSGLVLHTSKLFRDLSVDAKQYVMDQGSLHAFHQPAAELYGRVRQHLQNSTGKLAWEQKTPVQSQSVSYLDISNFIRESSLDAATEEAFRNQPIEVQMHVIGKGSVVGAGDTNALVKTRIREAQQELFAQASEKTQSSASNQMSPADLEAMEALLPKDEKQRQEVLAQQPADMREELERFMATRELENALLRADESSLLKCLAEARKFKVAQAKIIAAEGMLNSLRRQDVVERLGTASLGADASNKGATPVPKSGVSKTKLAVSKSAAKAPKADIKPTNHDRQDSNVGLQSLPPRSRLICENGGSQAPEEGPAYIAEGDSQQPLLESCGVWQAPEAAESWPEPVVNESASYTDTTHTTGESKPYDIWNAEKVKADDSQNNLHDTWDEEHSTGSNHEYKSHGVAGVYASQPWKADHTNESSPWSETNKLANQDSSGNPRAAVDNDSWDTEECNEQSDQGAHSSREASISTKPMWDRRQSDWDSPAASWATDSTKVANDDAWQDDNTWSASDQSNAWEMKDTQEEGRYGRGRHANDSVESHDYGEDANEGWRAKNSWENPGIYVSDSGQQSDDGKDADGWHTTKADEDWSVDASQHENLHAETNARKQLERSLKELAERGAMNVYKQQEHDSNQKEQHRDDRTEDWSVGDEGRPNEDEERKNIGMEHNSVQRPSPVPSSKLKLTPVAKMMPGAKLTPVAKWAPKPRYSDNAIVKTQCRTENEMKPRYTATPEDTYVVEETHVDGYVGQDNENGAEKGAEEVQRSRRDARPPLKAPSAIKREAHWPVKSDSAGNNVPRPPSPPRRSAPAPPQLPNMIPPSSLDLQALTVTGGKSGWEEKAHQIFQENGFVIVKGALKAPQCEAVLQECNRVASKMPGTKELSRFRLGDCNPKGTLLHLPIFARHLLCGAGAKLRPLLNRIFESEEGGALRFSCISGNGTAVEAGVDSYEELSHDARVPYAEEYFPPPLVAVDCCVQALSDAGGAPRLIPGTHLKKEEVPKPEPGEWKRSRVAPLPQGAAIVRDARLLRGMTPNLSDQILLLPCIEYASDEFLTGPDFDDANFPSMRCLPQKIFEKMPPQIQELCVEIVSE